MASEGGLSLTLAEIAARLGGDVLGDGQTRVFRVATLASAGSGDIAFLANPKYRSQLQTTRASAVIVAPAAHLLGARLPRPAAAEQVADDSPEDELADRAGGHNGCAFHDG